MVIVEAELDLKEGSGYFFAETAGNDLINISVDGYEASEAKSLAFYFDLFFKNSGYEIGQNDASEQSRKLKWDSEEENGLKRLVSLVKRFDCEMRFRYEIDDLKVLHSYVDIIKKVGVNNYANLFLDKQINSIKMSGSFYDLRTAVKGYGAEEESEDEETSDEERPKINLIGYDYTDEKGRFVLNKETGVMVDTVATKIWGILDKTGTIQPIVRVQSFEAKSQATLCQSVLGQLKKYSSPSINYETDLIELPDDVKLGDTVYIVDNDTDFYSEARVLEISKSYSNGDYKAVLGDYLIKSGLSTGDLVDMVEDGNIRDDELNKKVIVALKSANGKNTVYIGEEKPPNPKINGIWFAQEGEQKTLYIWNGEEWVKQIGTGDIDAVKKGTVKSGLNKLALAILTQSKKK